MVVESQPLVGAALSALALSAVALAACGRLEPRPPAAGPDTPGKALAASPSSAVSPPTAPSGESAIAATASASDGAAAARAESEAGTAAVEATALAECVSPRAQLVLPPRGAIFNNAVPREKAKAGDRAQGVLDALAEHAHPFACCFDPWLDGTTDAEARVVLRVALDPGGAVRAAHVVPPSVLAEDTRTARCLAHVAATISFPASPSGKETVVKYPLRAIRGGSTTNDR